MTPPVAKNVSITFATSLLSSGATAVGALVVAHALGARGAGLFTLARVVPTVAAGMLGAALSGSLNFVLRPLFANLSAEEARTQGTRLLRSFFAVNLLAVAALWLACGIVIDRLFGPQFAAATPACRILLLGLIGFGIDGVLNGFNVGTGRPELNAYAAVVGLAITLAGDLTLISRYGLTGAALTSAAAYTAKAVALAAVFVFTAARTGVAPGEQRIAAGRIAA